MCNILHRVIVRPRSRHTHAGVYLSNQNNFYSFRYGCDARQINDTQRTSRMGACVRPIVLANRLKTGINCHAIAFQRLLFCFSIFRFHLMHASTRSSSSVLFQWPSIQFFTVSPCHRNCRRVKTEPEPEIGNSRKTNKNNARVDKKTGSDTQCP